MTDIQQIVALAEQDGTGVLVTLVRVEGSSYRRPGARLLTLAGQVAGSVSGGCLEGEVIRRAPWIVRGGAAVETYAMTFDDTSDIPFGLGCGGTVDLLFEPTHTPEGTALVAAMRASLAGRESTVVSFLPGEGKALRRAVYDAAGEVVFRSDGLEQRRIDCARLLAAGQPYAGRFIERLCAPQRLVIFGAGDDARPLCGFAAQLGWSVVVADGRASLARRDRFPAAGQVVALDPAGSALASLCVTERDAAVLMTHSYEQDRALLTALLPAAPRYLGLLGSRHRSSLLLGEAATALGRTLAWACGRVFAPVGLDLGGDGPEAIALAIAAEAQAVCQGHPIARQRLDAGEVERQIAAGGASLYLQTQCAFVATK